MVAAEAAAEAVMDSVPASQPHPKYRTAQELEVGDSVSDSPCRYKKLKWAFPV